MSKAKQDKLPDGRLGYVKLKNGKVYKRSSTNEIGGYRIILKDGFSTKFVFYSEVDTAYFE